MPINIKELIVILAIALTVFALARPLMLRFGGAQDFARRRNVWLLLTATAFLSPNFWIFALVAAPVLLWAGRKDPNPLALYLMLLQLIPSTPIAIPVVGINALFDLDIYRLLSFCVLVPAALRLRRSTEFPRPHRLGTIDFLVIAYGVVQVIFYVRPDLASLAEQQDSFSNGLRRGFLFLVDSYLSYYVASRFCNRARLIEALANFCLACVIIAPLAVFESARSWLLYSDLVSRWIPGIQLHYYLFRGGFLRAVVSAVHSLALGYLLAVGLGLWFYLQHRAASWASRTIVTLMLCAGLIAAYSRGPWLGAVVIFLTYEILAMKAQSRLLKVIAGASIVVGGLLVSPLGDRITSVLPFLGGSVDAGTITYRQQLIGQALELIREHPWFGDQLLYQHLPSLRQGEGVIDLVNTYIEVALSYGLIGLTLFLSIILLALYRAVVVLRRVGRSDQELTLLGASIAACIVGTLVMLGTCSFIAGYPQMFYMLAGIAVAYAKLPTIARRATAKRHSSSSARRRPLRIFEAPAPSVRAAIWRPVQHREMP